MQARLHTGTGGAYLWVVNAAREPQKVEVTLPEAYRSGEDVWGARPVAVTGRGLKVEVGDRDVAVVRLR